MEEILNNNYISILFDEQNKILEVSAKPESTKLTDDELKETNLLVVDFIKKLQPKYYIANNKNFENVYSVDIQQWVITIFVTAFIEVGIKKTAQIKPQEFIASLSFEQVVDDAKEMYQLPFETKYFDNTEDAIHWFLN
ncbi:MAG: hypothetical protein EAZ85_11730 [Bacteroidetes bacterium]|nr:MAG: hypothetical protein EAZ85_11730 [Bacteroidota bacterium]